VCVCEQKQKQHRNSRDLKYIEREEMN